jgi:endonuclease-3 related protein
VNLTERLFHSLLDHYGPQGWWPADSTFGVMAGAILVQNTTWAQAARAVAALDDHRLLSPKAICQTSPEFLGELIRSAGTYRIKSRRLKALASHVQTGGGLRKLRHQPTERLRAGLLAVDGIGPETADAILLYAFDRPVFVADAYARRILQRIHADPCPPTAANYAHYRGRVEACDFGVAELNEFHALLVEHGKRCCRARPLCGACVAVAGCRFTGSPD